MLHGTGATQSPLVSCIEQNFHADDRWIRLATREHFRPANTRCSGNWKSLWGLTFLRLHFSGFYRPSLLESTNVSFHQSLAESYFVRLTATNDTDKRITKTDVGHLSVAFTAVRYRFVSSYKFNAQRWKRSLPIGRLIENRVKIRKRRFRRRSSQQLTWIVHCFNDENSTIVVQLRWSKMTSAWTRTLVEGKIGETQLPNFFTEDALKRDLRQDRYFECSLERTVIWSYDHCTCTYVTYIGIRYVTGLHLCHAAKPAFRLILFSFFFTFPDG